MAPPKATDVGWSHGTMVNGDRQKIKCNYCSKIMLGGGISRLKQHLAGERGNISPCEKVPDEVRAQIQQHIGFKTLGKLKKQKESDNIEDSSQNFNNDDYDNNAGHNSGSKRGAYGKKRGKEVEDMWPNKRKRTQKPFVSQAMMNSTFASQESINQADMAVAKFMYDAGIPLKTASSYYFQKMADAIASVGPGYRMPSYQSLRNKLLDKCGHEVGEICKEIRKSWKVTGCTVMVDRWVDAIGRVVINFFVYCPKGTILIKSVDASDIEHNTDGLLSVFDSVVHAVGPSNIVNFITDTMPSYKAAGKMLMKKHRTFFWSVCANHIIESVLKEFSELDEVKEVLMKAKGICQFIYNNSWVLSLLRKRTEGADIFQPANTEFVTKFTTLDSMVSLKNLIHQIFASTLQEQPIYSKQETSEEVTETVLSFEFWLSCEKVVKVSKPLVTVLHIADSEGRPSMGYLYHAMEEAKKSIILAFDNEEKDCLPYLKIIDHARDKFHCPLHAAAYYFNPAIYYSSNFSMNNVVQKGLLDCVETLEPNLMVQVNIIRHKAYYEDAFGDFSRLVALRGRETLSPATWWSLYSSDYPDLQRFAVRILSQACSITAPERTWNVNECIQSRKTNKLERERLTDLTFIHYNLRLQQRQLRTSGTKEPRRGEQDPISLEGRNYNIGEWIEDPGIVKGEDSSWMNVAPPSEDDNDSNDDSIRTETSD